MQLQEWLERNDLGYDSLAKFIGCSVFAVRKWVSGQREPRPIWREKIRKLTKDAVTANDWHENSLRYIRSERKRRKAA